jgi:aryl-alcohol dehydrogenase-like predicted oxidoreductase
LAHSPKALLIAGTRSIAHLEQNVAAGEITLATDALARLDAVGGPPGEGLSGHGIEPFLSD